MDLLSHLIAIVGDVVLRITRSPYWDFFSTLLAMSVGVIATWLFARKYFALADRHTRQVNALIFEMLKRLTGGKVYIIRPKDGRPEEGRHGQFRGSCESLN